MQHKTFPLEQSLVSFEVIEELFKARQEQIAQTPPSKQTNVNDRYLKITLIH